MINIFFWNIRRIGNSNTKRRLEMIKNKFNISIIAIQESIIDPTHIFDLITYLKLSNYLYNINGKIWVLWNHDWNVNIIGNSDQITLYVSSNNFAPSYLFSCVYAKCNYIERRSLWDEIIHTSSFRYESWIIGGDFNITCNQEGRRGGNVANINGILDFKSMMLNADLHEIPFFGSRFTWTQVGSGRVSARLDRVLANDGWFTNSFHSHVEDLHRTNSDHCPKLHKLSNPHILGPKPFRFQNIWTSHGDFLNVVQSAWGSLVSGSPMTKFALKLRILKNELKAWNNNTFNILLTELEMLRTMS